LKLPRKSTGAVATKMRVAKEQFNMRGAMFAEDEM
jgi:hypothetical protein